MAAHHKEKHSIDTIGCLHAAVLGANDGIVSTSTSTLILGVAASHATHNSILIAGVSALVAGAMSMATGEYVSVQSQADTEAAALEAERIEIQENPKGENRELTGIYVERGLEVPLLSGASRRPLLSRCHFRQRVSNSRGSSNCYREF